MSKIQVSLCMAAGAGLAVGLYLAGLGIVELIVMWMVYSGS